MDIGTFFSVRLVRESKGVKNYGKVIGAMSIHQADMTL